MAKAKPNTVKKPRPDFPLFPHARGYWAKKVRGQLHYFGKVADDPKGKLALDKWLAQKDDLLAGRTPRTKAEGLTIRGLCNQFLTAKKSLVVNREITARTFTEQYATCERVGEAFGWNRLVVDLAADDFSHLRRAIAKQWGPIRLGNEVQRVRSLFKFGFDAGLIQTPIRFGPAFKKPARKVMRLNRAKKGPRMLEAVELRAILDKASTPLRAMTLLGLNCGFGNTDVASLSMKALDLKRGWVDYPRPKTGVARRCPLWPETIAAVSAAIASRPKPRDKAHDGLVFLTKYGRPWRQSEQKPEEKGDNQEEHPKPKMKQDDAVSKEFAKLIRELKLHRPGLGFYALRHAFETIGGDSRDQIAVDAIMGHARDDMASAYRERIDDARLVAVVEHVRKWLFGEQETK